MFSCLYLKIFGLFSVEGVTVMFMNQVDVTREVDLQGYTWDYNVTIFVLQQV